MFWPRPPIPARGATPTADACARGRCTANRECDRVNMGAKSRVIRSLYATGFGQVVTVLVQLVGVPLFLHFWGVEKYGLWLILSTIPTYLSLSDFGFASAAANDMTMSVAGGRRDAAVKTFQSTFAVILGVSTISALVVAAVSVLQTRTGLLPISGFGGSGLAVLLAVFWGQVVVAQIGGVVYAGYRCDGNYAQGTLIGQLIRLVEFSVSAACLFVGGGFVAVALSVMVSRCVGVCVMGVDLRRRSPWLPIGIRGGSRGEIKRLVRPALAFMAIPISNALSIQGFVLVVGSLAGGSGVVLFSTYRTMTRFPLQIVGMVSNSVWPELSRSFGEGDIGLARKLHRVAVTSSVWLVLIATAAIVVLAEPILRLWTAGQVPFERGLFLVLAAAAVTNSLWSASSVVPASVNRFESIARVLVAGTVGALALAVGLGMRYGLQGISGALLAADVLVLIVVWPLSMSLTEDTPSDFVRWFAAAPRKSVTFLLRWRR